MATRDYTERVGEITPRPRTLPSELMRLRDALERGGAVFIDEDHRAGSGVRLKFNAKDVRAINRMEGEGGPVGTDDV